MQTLYHAARRNILNGDMALRRNPGGLIGALTPTDYSHAMLLFWHHGCLAVAESREFKGARVVTLKELVRQFPGQIDVFRPTCDVRVAQRASEVAFRQAGHQYNYRGVLRLGLTHAPVVRWFRNLRPNYQDLALTPWAEPKFCSQLVAWSYRWARQEIAAEISAYENLGWWDPVPKLNDRYIEPYHLGLSGAFNPLFEGLVIEGDADRVPKRFTRERPAGPFAKRLRVA